MHFKGTYKYQQLEYRTDTNNSSTLQAQTTQIPNKYQQRVPYKYQQLKYLTSTNNSSTLQVPTTST